MKIQNPDELIIWPYCLKLNIKQSKKYNLIFWGSHKQELLYFPTIVCLSPKSLLKRAQFETDRYET